MILLERNGCSVAASPRSGSRALVPPRRHHRRGHRHRIRGTGRGHCRPAQPQRTATQSTPKGSDIADVMVAEGIEPLPRAGRCADRERRRHHRRDRRVEVRPSCRARQGRDRRNRDADIAHRVGAPTRKTPVEEMQAASVSSVRCRQSSLHRGRTTRRPILRAGADEWAMETSGKRTTCSRRGSRTVRSGQRRRDHPERSQDDGGPGGCPDQDLTTSTWSTCPRSTAPMRSSPRRDRGAAPGVMAVEAPSASAGM